MFSPKLCDGLTGGASSTGVHVFQALPDRREGFLSLLIG